jgi:hypothetical protein
MNRFVRCRIETLKKATMCSLKVPKKNRVEVKTWKKIGKKKAGRKVKKNGKKKNGKQTETSFF